MNLTLFVGPSIGYDHVREIIPEATIRPPAEQGDLIAAFDLDQAELIGLIDGTFHNNLSVWHNEVCYLLSQGVTVVGASSMGALRAAETEDFGAIGLGTVFRWYRDGFITGDDEVALLHGDQESGYRQMSIPLVNVRSSLWSAVSRGELTDSEASDALAVARSIHYANRTVPQMVTKIQRMPGLERLSGQIEEALTIHYVDVKREDAAVLLGYVRELLDGRRPIPTPTTFDFARSSVFEGLYNMDRRVPASNGEVRLQDLFEHFTMNSPDAAEIFRAALHREIAKHFGMLLGLTAGHDELAHLEDAFYRERQLSSEATRADWRRSNGVTASDLREYLAEEVICDRLRRWVTGLHGFDRGSRAVLNELRRRGSFPSWATATAEESAIVSAFGDSPDYEWIRSADGKELAVEHAARTGTAIFGDAGEWAERHGFDGVNGLIDALRRSVLCWDVRSRVATVLEAVRGGRAGS